MNIKGIYADEADKLDPEQWVNIYRVYNEVRPIYHSSCQVKDLKLDYPEEYGLELVDEDGNLMRTHESVTYE